MSGRPNRIGGKPSLRLRQRLGLRPKTPLWLAFLAPALVKAAVEGRLPRGIGIERLRDSAAEWTLQFKGLGLNPQ
jgi:hypothetical protein